MGLMAKPIRRIEDKRFITGRGLYVDDVKMQGTAVGYALRSPYAHAKILSIDTEAAKAMPGVIGIIVGAELEAEGVGHLGAAFPASMLKNRDGSNRWDGDRALLTVDCVRYVGEPVAFVVAESINAAKDAAEQIFVDYEELPALASIDEALAPGAVQIWPQAPGNIALDWEQGDAAAVAAAFAKAAHISRIELVNNRIVVNSMEPRGAAGKYDKATDSYELYVTSQGSHPISDNIAKRVLRISKDKLRVITPDVGGGFGLKMSTFAEYALVLIASKRFGVPVKWMSERTEAFQSDSHGRDLKSTAEMAFDADGRILGYRVETNANLGAYGLGFGPGIQTAVPMFVIGGVYKVPVVYNHARAVFTNTVPVEAYRGAGRPEAAYVLERLMDQAARELGLGPDELRLRNFIPAGEMPFRSAVGALIDSGDFQRNLHDCMRQADWSGFAGRRAESEKRGLLRGIGLAYYMEKTAGGAGPVEICFTPNGRVEVGVGTSGHGQGHETTFAAIVADKLGVPMELIDLNQSDSLRAPYGGGTGGSRSLWSSGNGILKAADTVIGKGRTVAAAILNVAPEDVAFEEGAFRAQGSNRFLPLLEVAAAARGGTNLPADLSAGMPDGLDSSGTHDENGDTFPNGCHICEVEIDPDTGKVSVVAYNVVDDFGFVLNPLIVAGQVHGGVVQGIGQALLENCLYEPGTAQLQSGSFMDYAMPRADDFPPIKFTYNEILCTTNPLGIKGCGEAGTVGAAPAVMNAVLDALWARGVRHVDMPMTPIRVWETLQAAKG
ncbi:MAG TPA: xanthine dehydrogenase family protein molybdopterin-binding subunit [Alphaproteobacteria bacterium]|nr:xanthine dehydrogenase family protein molybdopterin-binding subunit [Alphaproteobacteria bacterium]